MNAIQDVFKLSTDAVFGINAAGSIQYTNRTFQRLLGYSRERMCGARCAQVLCGTDIQGNAFCGQHCPIPRTDVDGSSIGDFDLVVKSADGASTLVNIGACYLPRQLREQAGQVDVFFSLRPVDPQRLLRRISMGPVGITAMESKRSVRELTPREKEILGLAARGLQTEQIARKLCISVQTTRTHFRNIYPKLGVSSRTEAVIFAMQHDLP